MKNKILFIALFFAFLIIPCKAHALDYHAGFMKQDNSYWINLTYAQVNSGVYMNPTTDCPIKLWVYFDNVNISSGYNYTITLNHTVGRELLDIAGISSNQIRLGSSSNPTYVSFTGSTYRTSTTHNSSGYLATYQVSYTFEGTGNFTNAVLQITFNSSFCPNYYKINSINFTQVTDYQQIINNQNQNTQNIINNQNQNTQNIINNQNQNTEEITDAIGDLSDTLTDDNLGDVIHSGGGGGTYFDSIGVGSEAPISNIVLLPINLLNAISTNLEGSCSSYTMPFDFFGGNNTLTFQCWTLSDYLGSSITNVIDMMLCFFMIYEIAMLSIHFFEEWTSLTDTFDNLYSPKNIQKGVKE